MLILSERSLNEHQNDHLRLIGERDQTGCHSMFSFRKVGSWLTTKQSSVRLLDNKIEIIFLLGSWPTLLCSTTLIQTEVSYQLLARHEILSRHLLYGSQKTSPADAGEPPLYLIWYNERYFYRTFVDNITKCSTTKPNQYPKTSSVQRDPWCEGSNSKELVRSEAV